MSVQPIKLEAAKLEEIWWTDEGAPQETGPKGQKGKSFTVQFNPQTLKVNFTNQKAGGDQPKGSSTQFVGKGVTKLTLELWFDISLAIAQGRLSGDPDVRRLTGEVRYFMAPQEVTVQGKKGLAPPGLRFHWGSFLFDGVLDSMDETLDLFDADGHPLRASVSLSISKQEIIYASKNGALKDAPGVQPFEVMKAGEPLQRRAADWRGVALANGIENPRMLGAGALVNLSASLSVGGAAQLGVDISGGAQIGVSGGLSDGGGIQLGFSSGASVTGGGTISGDASGSLDASFTASGGFGGGV